MPHFAGWDHSPNHAGVVLLDASGAFVEAHFLCDKAAGAKLRGGTRFPPEIKKLRDSLERDVRRLDFSRGWIVQVVRHLGTQPELFCAVEDYAYGMGHGAHQIGEVGGLLRLALLAKNIPTRYHDPTSVKVFATDNGLATKDEVKRAVLERWAMDFSSWSAAAGDLTDAYVLARMALTEHGLRAGRITLDKLPDCERRVFLRVTKPRPINVLDRPWIRRADDEPA